jgi:GT2 family glycosyltransferase
MQFPSVAVIVINWNGYRHTEKCLQSLVMVRYPNFKIVVVDNASTGDDAKKIKTNFPEVKLIESKVNEGFTGGNNRGIEEALSENFDYIMLLNNDTEQVMNFLDKLVEFMQKTPEAVAAQPRIHYVHDKDKVWSLGGKYDVWLGLTSSLKKAKRNDPFEIDWLTGCCMLVRACVVKEVGQLDHNFFAYYEDVDWSFRMKRAGGRLYCVPEAVVYHVAGASGKTTEKVKEGFVSPFIHYLNIRNQIYFLRKHVDVMYLPSVAIYQLLLLSAYILYFSAKGRFTKLKAVIRGVRDGLKMPIK